MCGWRRWRAEGREVSTGAQPIWAWPDSGQWGKGINSLSSHTGPWLQAGTGGERPQALCTAHQQQGFPAVLHPHSGVPAQLLHARPWQRGLADHDSAAEQAGVRYWCPQTALGRPHRQKSGEQEPPQAAAPEVKIPGARPIWEGQPVFHYLTWAWQSILEEKDKFAWSCFLQQGVKSGWCTATAHMAL